jgi:hypothetical protein
MAWRLVVSWAVAPGAGDPPRGAQTQQLRHEPQAICNLLSSKELQRLDAHCQVYSIVDCTPW